MKEPPKLTDLFDPAGGRSCRAVSSAEIATRAANSCQANRVVPWLPVNVPTSPTGSRRPSNQPDHGCARRNNQITGRRAAAYQSVPGWTTKFSTPGTQRLKAGGAISGGEPGEFEQTPKQRRCATDQLRRTSTGTRKAHTDSWLAKTRFTKSRALFARAAIAILGGVFTGVWFVLNQGERSAVRRKVDDKQFAEAALAIKNSSSLLLPGKEELLKEVEAKWWDSMKGPAEDDDKDRLEKQSARLKEFQDAFPQHGDATARQGHIQALIKKSFLPVIDPKIAQARLEKRNSLLAVLKVRRRKSQAQIEVGRRCSSDRNGRKGRSGQ